MAGTRYIDSVTDAEKLTQVTSIRAEVQRWANDVLAHICGVTEWPFLWTTDWFQTVAPYETGTVAVTNASTTVTGTGTTFTAAMVGRKFRVENQTGYYLIKAYVSATELTLEQAYTGDTDTEASYSVYKDEYLLRADVDSQKQLKESENGIALFSLSPFQFDNDIPIPSGEGVPHLSVYRGRAVKTYATGTVAMTSGTRIITGSSTLWTSVEGLTRGTKLKIGSLIFTINTVDSATQVTVYEVATATIAAGTSYTAILDNPVVQLHSIPDQILTIYYSFQRLPAVLSADNDLPDLPYPMHPLISLGVLPNLWRHKGMMDRVEEAKGTFAATLESWMVKYSQPVTDRRILVEPFSIRRRTREAGWPMGTGIPLYR